MKQTHGQQDQPRGRAENILNGDTHSGLEQHEREFCAGVYDEFHRRVLCVSAQRRGRPISKPTPVAWYPFGVTINDGRWSYQPRVRP